MTKVLIHIKEHTSHQVCKPGPSQALRVHSENYGLVCLNRDEDKTRQGEPGYANMLYSLNKGVIHYPSFCMEDIH